MTAMKTRTFLMAGLLLALAAANGGCAKRIGDGCGSALDCNTGQVCDLSLPGGYCTVTPCELDPDTKDDTCPNEAVCIDYPPFSSYCMERCESDDDCREYYACVESLTKQKYCGVPDEQPQ
jgi:hypothetical protein